MNDRQLSAVSRTEGKIQLKISLRLCSLDYTASGKQPQVIEHSTNIKSTVIIETRRVPALLRPRQDLTMATFRLTGSRNGLRIAGLALLAMLVMNLYSVEATIDDGSDELDFTWKVSSRQLPNSSNAPNQAAEGDCEDQDSRCRCAICTSAISCRSRQS